MSEKPLNAVMRVLLRKIVANGGVAGPSGLLPLPPAVQARARAEAALNVMTKRGLLEREGRSAPFWRITLAGRSALAKAKGEGA